MKKSNHVKLDFFYFICRFLNVFEDLFQFYFLLQMNFLVGQTTVTLYAVVSVRPNGKNVKPKVSQSIFRKTFIQDLEF